MSDLYVTQSMLKFELSEFKTELKTELRQAMSEQEVRLKAHVNELIQEVLIAVGSSFDDTRREFKSEIRLVRKDITVLTKLVKKHEKVFPLLHKIISQTN